jgi:predicted phosphodiesterase
MTALIQGAGLEVYHNQPEAKGKKFKYPEIEDPEKIREIITNLNKRKEIVFNNAKKIFIIGDVHFPFVNIDALNACYELIKKEKPDVVIQQGDLDDQYSNSKFPKSQNVYSPKAEDDLARSMAEEMWAKIRSIVPKAKCYQLMGNHNARALLRVVEKWPEGEHMIEYYMRHRMTFEGVETIHDPTQELYINGILFIHGHYSQLGAHRDYNTINVVTGHSHRGGVNYRSYNGKVYWELNVGFIGDPESKALSYRKQKYHNWTWGCGIIDSLGPRFVAF